MQFYFSDNVEDDSRFISWEPTGIVKINYFGELNLSGQYPGKESITSSWHHAAIAYKNHQIKCYTDQHRVLVVPNCVLDPTEMYFGAPMSARLRKQSKPN